VATFQNKLPSSGVGGVVTEITTKGVLWQKFEPTVSRLQVRQVTALIHAIILIQLQPNRGK
jgi:hypothetical protein